MPGGEEAPKTTEFIEVYSAGAVRIEHSYHHTHCVRVER